MPLAAVGWRREGQIFGKSVPSIVGRHVIIKLRDLFKGLTVEHFEATGDTRRSPIKERPDLTAEELNARFEDHFGS
jgi:hypothetical protein